MRVKRNIWKTIHQAFLQEKSDKNAYTATLLKTQRITSSSSVIQPRIQALVKYLSHLGSSATDTLTRALYSHELHGMEFSHSNWIVQCLVKRCAATTVDFRTFPPPRKSSRVRDPPHPNLKQLRFLFCLRDLPLGHFIQMLVLAQCLQNSSRCSTCYYVNGSVLSDDWVILYPGKVLSPGTWVDSTCCLWVMPLVTSQALCTCVFVFLGSFPRSKRTGIRNSGWLSSCFQTVSHSDCTLIFH